jgi:hypothetical protein
MEPTTRHSWQRAAPVTSAVRGPLSPASVLYMRSRSVRPVMWRMLVGLTSRAPRAKSASSLAHRPGLFLPEATARPALPFASERAIMRPRSRSVVQGIGCVVRGPKLAPVGHGRGFFIGAGARYIRSHRLRVPPQEDKAGLIQAGDRITLAARRRITPLSAGPGRVPELIISFRVINRPVTKPIRTPIKATLER